MELKNLISDLKILKDLAEQDYHAQRFDPYPDYIRQFNDYLEKSKTFGINDITAIQTVPEGKMIRGGSHSAAEKAKLREIVSTSILLLRRLLYLENPNSSSKMDDIEIVKNIILNFQKVANQLLRRYSNRETLKITDEYDVQDLLHSLLKLFFDDIRPEEWTPSYAGKSSRMDFLLKKEQIVIEVKKTRDGLGQKEIGDQLLVDIGKYSIHQDCKTLICFVYDPDYMIDNPSGVENDLNNKSDDKMKVIVMIAPK